MNNLTIGMGLTALIMSSATVAKAQDAAFTWEGSVEIGVDSTISADDRTSEITDGYLSIELAFEAAITDRLSAFGGLTLESVTDPENDRTFEDMGLYVAELGLRYSFGDTIVSAGKISPVFAVAWDEAPGFYGTSLTGDYELSEMIGVTIDTSAGPDGTLSFAAFYADNTELSDSIGTNRGRSRIADGGVGNTGKLNNVAVQYTRSFGETTAWVGARHLSAGADDTADENGAVIGFAHDFGNGFDMIGEVARFESATDATYATLGGAYALDAWTFSATATVIDYNDATSDRMIAIGVDRALSDTVELNVGLARFDIGGEKSTALGVAAVLSF